VPIADGRVLEEDRRVRGLVRELTGADPRELRFRDTDQGLLAFLTLALPPDMTLVDAHETASEIERRICDGQTSIFDVVVHTEPA
jgi:divalent metal cation (Fe/Co/Zn/Cd) transporter